MTTDDIFLNRCYSQEGEDLVLRELFTGKTDGFYIDVGALHPKRFSNTYCFYLLGWHGINIDAMPGSMELFNRERPRDINLEVAISDKKEKLIYYMFNEPALNGFSKEISEKRNIEPYKIINQKEMFTCTLAEILDRYLSVGTKIDYLNVDVEGLDLQVLKSNNWSKYRPQIILVEDLNLYDSIDEYRNSGIVKYLNEQKYVLFSKTIRTLFFKNQIESR